MKARIMLWCWRRPVCAGWDSPSRISFALPVEVCVPAPGQGIVAVEVRAADTPVQRLLGTIDDEGQRRR